VLAGSTWNVNVLRQLGLPSSKIALFRQGVDPSLFSSNQQVTGFKYREMVNKKADEKFYIFSGGKLEFRKGQDLVVAAFRRFLQVCPNAVLVVAWANGWMETVKTMGESNHTIGYPGSRPPLPHEPAVMGALNILPWLQSNGIPSDNVIDVGVVEHAQMAEAIKMADVALFPNRCEGGTNLVAMEAAAVGLPLILSTATGHADLSEFLSVSPVGRQGNSKAAYLGLFDQMIHYESSSHRMGWSEANVDEIVEALTMMYRNDRGSGASSSCRVGAQKMKDEWSWIRAVEGLGRIIVKLRSGLSSK
jgi:glycosyltransferase involved in cell wall biosynthesis